MNYVPSSTEDSHPSWRQPHHCALAPLPLPVSSRRHWFPAARKQLGRAFHRTLVSDRHMTAAAHRKLPFGFADHPACAAVNSRHVFFVFYITKDFFRFCFASNFQLLGPGPPPYQEETAPGPLKIFQKRSVRHGKEINDRYYVEFPTAWFEPSCVSKFFNSPP